MPLSKMGFQLIITGDVSVEQCKSVSKAGDWCILILGPTGAGKSSFIEALSGEGQSLGISKDQLAGFTQEVSAYEVKNIFVQWDDDDIQTCPLCLIDTPGFSDSKISELEIITKVQQWLSDHGVRGVLGVLYLTPVTDTRAPGSKRRTIKMVQLLLWDKAFDSVNIVTTMWDRLSNPQAKNRAEMHFAQLRDEIWRGPISGGAKISRFHNDFDSAIQILRDIIEQQESRNAPLECSPITPGRPSTPFLYKELLDRISNAQQEKEHLRREKMCLITNPDLLLAFDVCSRLSEVKCNLEKFLGQLVAFGDPPPGFEGVIPGRCFYQNLLDHVHEAQEEHAVLKQALAQLHMNPDGERKMMLKGQLDLVKRKIAQHVKRLGQYGAPPEGYNRELEHALDGVSLGASLQYHTGKGLRFFKDKLRLDSRHKI